jgi:hypothetical protein
MAREGVNRHVLRRLQSAVAGQRIYLGFCAVAAESGMVRLGYSRRDGMRPGARGSWSRWWCCIWRRLKREDGLVAVAVYGSVARGEAGPGSDIDVLLVAADEAAKQRFTEAYGSVRLTVGDQSKLCMTEVYTESEDRNSVGQGSTFLENVRAERHLVYDPDRLLDRPEAVGQ